MSPHAKMEPLYRDYEPAVASMSLGAPSVHPLSIKLKFAALRGFNCIEISHDDIQASAAILAGSRPTTNEDELEVAEQTRHLCSKIGLRILCLQPLRHFEGLTCPIARAKAFDALEHWFNLAAVLGTDMILIPSNFLPKDQTTGDLGVIVEDLQQAADIGRSHEPPIRIAYEALSWGTWTNTWEDSWDIVVAVDRPNFGICLDTFNILARCWADPTSPSGRLVDAETELSQSLLRMLERIDTKKIFFVQVVDGERLDSPLVPGHPFYVESQPPLMSWSRNSRLFAYEDTEGAYLPVREVLDVIFHTLGWKGPVSMELFNRRLSEKGAIPEEFSRRAWQSWLRMEQDLGLGEEPEERFESVLEHSLNVDRGEILSLQPRTLLTEIEA